MDIEQDRTPGAGRASRRVYGEPFETADGSTVIPVARVGGLRRSTVTPVGVFVIHGGEVTWSPALDHTRVALLGSTIGLVAAIIGALAVLRRPPWPDLSNPAGSLAQRVRRTAND